MLPFDEKYGATETPFIFDISTGSLKVDLTLYEIDQILKIRAIKGTKFLDSASFSIKSFCASPTYIDSELTFSKALPDSDSTEVKGEILKVPTGKR